MRRRLSLAIQGHVVVPVGGLVAAGIVLAGMLFCTYQFAHRMGSLAAPGEGAAGRSEEGAGIAGPLQLKRPQMMQDQDQRREQPGARPEEPAVVPRGPAVEQPAGAGIGALAGGDGPPPKPEPRTVRGFRVISYGDTPANRATAAEFKEHLHTHGIADVELVQDKTTLCVFVPAAGDSKADLEALRKRLQSVPPPRFDSKFRFDDLLPGRLTRN